MALTSWPCQQGWPCAPSSAAAWAPSPRCCSTLLPTRPSRGTVPTSAGSTSTWSTPTASSGDGDGVGGWLGARGKGLGLSKGVSPCRRFISAACCVPEPEERFDMDEYSEMVAVAKPVIYITVGELINTHKVRA